jgi:hypothetical protein
VLFLLPLDVISWSTSSPLQCSLLFLLCPRGPWCFFTKLQKLQRWFMAVRTNQRDRELLFSEELLNLAKCGICHELNDVNHLLTCAHSLCANDLATMFKISRNITCPFCKKISSAKQVTDFPRDFHKNSLVGLIKQSMKQKCVECEKEAVAYCKEDKEFYCLWHVELAHLIGKSKKHRIVCASDSETELPLGKIKFRIEELKPQNVVVVPVKVVETPAFPCSRCGSVFDKKDKLISHTRWTHFFCEICNKSFQKEQSIEAHMSSCHSGTVECRFCGKTFGSERSLHNHCVSSGHFTASNSEDSNSEGGSVDSYYY